MGRRIRRKGTGVLDQMGKIFEERDREEDRKEKRDRIGKGTEDLCI